MKAGGSTPNALLGLLSIRPMSGYDIRQLVAWSIGHFWSESYGQIYPALKRLTAEGLIEKETERRKGKPDRNVYSLTAAGRKELRRWLKLPAEPTPQRNELLLKIFFGANAANGVCREQIAAYEAESRATSKVFEAKAKQLKKERGGNPQLPFWLMTLNFGRHRSLAAIEWCAETRRELERMEK